MADNVEKVVIIGSGPAGWTAAIYAARADLRPLVFEGNPLWPDNQANGTLPLGQLALTTEVENYPGLPAGKSREYLASALPPERQPYWGEANKPQPSHGINGPEMMEVMRQQAANCGTPIIPKDVHRRDQLRASKIMQQRAFDNPKIALKWNRALHEVLGTDQAGVTGAHLKSTTDKQEERLDASGVFLAIGHTPNTAFLEGQVELDE